MKTQLALLLALSALALTARADQCETSSNRLRFVGSSQSSVVNACIANYSTNNFDCEQNVSCDRDDDRSFNNDRPGQGPGQGFGHGPGSGQQGPGQGHGQQWPGQNQPPPNQWQPPQQGGGQHGGGNQGGPGQQQSQPPQQQPGPHHSLPNGSYQRSCRNADMNGTYLSADCKNFRGKWVFSQLDLNRCNPQSDVGNNNGQLNCAPR